MCFHRTVREVKSWQRKSTTREKDQGELDWEHHILLPFKEADIIEGDILYV